MAIFFIDSLAHYTTALQGNTKINSMEAAPSAGTGAFGAPGSNGYYIVNHAAIPTIEVSAYVFSGAFAPPFARTLFSVTTLPVEAHIYVYLTFDGRIGAWRQDYAGFSGALVGLGESAAGLFVFGTQHHIKFTVNIHDTTGSIVVKLDGATVLNLTNIDTRSNGGSYGLPNAEITQTRLYSSSIWSHLAFADTAGDIVGAPRVQALFPDGVGTYSEWTPLAGANWTNVEETTPDEDTSYVLSSTVGHRDLYTYENALASTGTIQALQVVPRVRKTDAAVHDIAAMVRTGGADFVGATKAVGASYLYFPTMWQQNPNTVAAWTPAEINAIEAGVKVIT